MSKSRKTIHKQNHIATGRWQMYQSAQMHLNVELPQLDMPPLIRTPTAVYDTRFIEKDINGVEYTYENKDELAFGTTYEGEENDELP
jgi:hypothetical protein